MMGYHLKPLKKKRASTKKSFGFDIETYGDKNDFLMCSVFSDEHTRQYKNKADFINDLKTNVAFRDCIIYATNLGFDFFGSLGDELMGFSWMNRGSDLIFAKTYAYNGKFNRGKRKSGERILFLDSMNYHRASVEQLGKIIGFPKIKRPEWIGEIPKTDEEWRFYREYNLKDSEITYRFMKKLIDKFISLGIAPQYTIAGTAMNYFKSSFLDKTYYSKPENITLDLFEGYYGGRTEVFKRGSFKDVNYYDINSLYPSVMLNDFPDPNTLRHRRYGDIGHIENFEGQSYIEAYCPERVFPLLPFRYGEKLIFPTGHISGSYCHNEIRKAIQLGYIIKKIGKQYYFKGICRPFDDYVKTLYSLRKATKKTDFMNIVYKLLLNSLYGKFAQKFKDRSMWHINNFTADELEKFARIEINGDFIRVTEDRRPSSFCIPIWSSYVTAYGRIKLYDYLQRCDPLMCDTDSIITKKKIPESEELGFMKLVDTGTCTLIRPKFYRFNDDIKLKGCPMRLTKDKFIDILEGKPIRKMIFLKLAQSIRQKKGINEKVELVKEFDIIDTKRKWQNKFDYHGMEDSIPLHIMESGATEEDIRINKNKTFIKNPILPIYVR